MVEETLAVVSNCYVCQVALADGEGEQINRYIDRAFQSMEHCHTCAEQLCAEQARREEERRENERQFRRQMKRGEYSRLKQDGLLRDDFRDTCFKKSDPAIEALNPTAWAKGREWPMEANLCLYGSVGVGKSFLARCILYAAFMADCSVAELNARRFTKIVDRFDEGDGILDKWKSADFLLIDDVDKADWNFSRLTALLELLDHRAASKSRRTIITCNLSPSELRTLFRACSTKGEISNASLADATLDRMKPITTFEMKGDSQR